MRLIGAGTARRFTRCTDAIEVIDRMPIDWEERGAASEKTQVFAEEQSVGDARGVGRAGRGFFRLLLVTVLLFVAWLYLTETGHIGFWLNWIRTSLGY